MIEYDIDGVIIKIENGNIPEEEAAAYVDRGRERYGKRLREIVATLDTEEPDMIDIEYKFDPVPFNRLRRITGYLVGNIGRWNNAKRAEEHDRLKHG